MLAMLRSQREFEQSLDYYHDCRPDCSQPLLPLPQIHYLDCSVQWGTGEGVIVFGVDDDLHDIVGVSLKHLVTGPLLVPVPQLDQHVIYNTQQPVSLHMSSTTQNCWKYTILCIHKSSLSALQHRTINDFANDTTVYYCVIKACAHIKAWKWLLN